MLNKTINKTIRTTTATLLALGMLLAAGQGSSLAQGTAIKPPPPGKPAAADPKAPAPPADSTPKVKVERGAGGHKVYRITEEIRIEGKIQKPEAFFFYQKSSINYDWQELKQDFMPKILDSVSRAPF